MPDYRLDRVRARTADYVRHEQHLAEILRSEPEQGQRLKDAIYARCLCWEVQDAIRETLARAGMRSDWFLAQGKDWMSDFMDDMPSVAIQIALTPQIFKNASRAWSGNDLRDIDALSGAVPYCNVVVTEKHAADVLNRKGLAERFGTLVMPRLTDLEAYLGQLSTA